MKKTEKECNYNNLQSNSSSSVEDSIFSTVFNNNQAIMLLVDPTNHRILDANGAAEKFYGCARDKLLTMDMKQINILSSEDRYRRVKEAIRKSQGSSRFVHKTCSGMIKNVEVYTSEIVYNKKNTIFIIVHDVTEQKVAEFALKESEERLGLALAGTDLGLWDEWISTGELHVNNRWAEILGHTLEEISPISMNFWRENTHPDDLKEVDKIGLKYPRKENDIINHDIRMKHKNGNWVWIRTKGKVSEWSDNGEPLRLSGTHLDITEQKNIEIKLKESEEKYRSYFENSPLSLWEEDFTEVMAYLNGLPVTGVEDIRNYLDIHPEEVKKCVEMVKILDVNPATLRLYDAQSKEDLYWNLDNVFAESAYEFFKGELICLYKNEQFFSAETIGRTLTGRTIEIKLEMALLYDNRVLVTIMDITELKRKETELMELLKQTKADTETKEILLREINHRVKNNLSAFIGMLYAEKRQSDHKMEDTQLVLIDSMINRVKGISIAHNLLSRSGWTPISVYTLSEKIIHSLSHLIPTDRLIETKITPSLVFLNADQSQNMAVVINELFANCIEHAANAGEKIKVKIEIKESKGKISCIYSDNGPGFPEKVLNSGFHNVGLYLIKNIIRQNLRGTVKMENKDGARVILQFSGGTEFEEL